MPIKWTIAIMMFMLLATVLFGIVEKGEGTVAGTGVFDTLSEIQVQDIVNPANWVINFFTGDSIEWSKALLDAAMFNYTMFESGAWQWIKFFFWCISLSWIVSLVITLMRGTSSV